MKRCGGFFFLAAVIRVFEFLFIVILVIVPLLSIFSLFVLDHHVSYFVKDVFIRRNLVSCTEEVLLLVETGD